MDANEYKAILAEHGRRVANRVAFAAIGRGSTVDGLAGFYAMYGPEDRLPENECSKPDDPMRHFDPTGWSALYRGNLWGDVARQFSRHINPDFDRISKSLTELTGSEWPLTGEDAVFVYCIPYFTDAQLTASAERLGRRGQHGWADFILDLTDEDILSMEVIRHPRTRWPDPVAPNASDGVDSKWMRNYLGIAEGENGEDTQG